MQQDRRREVIESKQTNSSRKSFGQQQDEQRQIIIDHMTGEQDDAYNALLTAMENTSAHIRDRVFTQFFHDTAIALVDEGVLARAADGRIVTLEQQAEEHLAELGKRVQLTMFDQMQLDQLMEADPAVYRFVLAEAVHEFRENIPEGQRRLTTNTGFRESVVNPYNLEGLRQIMNTPRPEVVRTAQATEGKLSAQSQLAGQGEAAYYQGLEELYLRWRGPEGKEKLMLAQENLDRPGYERELREIEIKILFQCTTSDGGQLLLALAKSNPRAYRDVLDHLREIHFPPEGEVIRGETPIRELIAFMGERQLPVPLGILHELHERERAVELRAWREQRGRVERYRQERNHIDVMRDFEQGSELDPSRRELHTLRERLDYEQEQDDRFMPQLERNQQRELENLHGERRALIYAIGGTISMEGRNVNRATNVREDNRVREARERVIRLHGINDRRLRVIQGQGGEDTLDELDKEEDRLLKEIEKRSLNRQRTQTAAEALRGARQRWRDLPGEQRQVREVERQRLRQHAAERREELLHFLGDHGLQLQLRRQLRPGEFELLGEALRLRVQEHLQPQGALQFAEADGRRGNFRIFLARHAEQIQEYLQHDEYLQLQEYMQTPDYLQSREYLQIQRSNEREAMEIRDADERLREAQERLRELTDEMARHDRERADELERLTPKA